jgi:hypothetical protein
MKRMVRQGDVLLVPVEQAPVDVEPVELDHGRIVLAHGEATGHAHVVEGEAAELVSAAGAEELYLLVHGETPALLRHDEHDPIPLAPGAYRVVRQREYAPSVGTHATDETHVPAESRNVRFVVD